MELIVWAFIGFPCTALIGFSLMIGALLGEFVMWQIWTEPLWPMPFYGFLIIQIFMLLASHSRNNEAVPGPVVLSAVIAIATLAGNRIVPVSEDDPFAMSMELERHRNTFSDFTTSAGIAGHMVLVGIFTLIVCGFWLWFVRRSDGYRSW